MNELKRLGAKSPLQALSELTICCCLELRVASQTDRFTSQMNCTGRFVSGDVGRQESISIL